MKKIKQAKIRRDLKGSTVAILVSKDLFMALALEMKCKQWK